VQSSPGERSSGPRGRPWRRSQWTPLARALNAMGDHWTLPIALQLAGGRKRPVQLQRQLTGISSSVLDRRLQDMVALGLARTERFREMPPRVEVALTEAGRELLPSAGALARWGMRHAWSAPRAGELIDVDALLGLLPLLLEQAARLPDGTFELTVEQPGGDLRRRFRIAGCEVSEQQAEESKPTASVAGDTDAWIAALGPARDYQRLRFAGRKALARRVLEALPVAPEKA